jgi:hypothetical protein
VFWPQSLFNYFPKSNIREISLTLYFKVANSKKKEAELAKTLHGQIAIANAKIAYQIYKKNFGSGRFKKLRNKGARTQRLL